MSRELTENPHVAGNVSDVDVALLVYNHWKGYNFDKVEMTNYTVLLQYPGNYTHPNQLQLRDSAGDVIYDAPIQQEKPLLPEERDPSVAPPFNAYSGTGNATVRNRCSLCPSKTGNNDYMGNSLVPRLFLLAYDL